MFNQYIKNQISFESETAHTKHKIKTKFGIRASAAVKPQGNHFFLQFKEKQMEV